MSAQDFFGEFRAQAALFPQPPLLRIRGAGDDDNAVEPSFGLRFKKQRKIDEQPTAGAVGFIGPCTPPGADNRVENGFEQATSGVVFENQFTEPLAIGLSRRVAGRRAECLIYRLLNIGVIRQQIMRTSVGIE